MKWILSFFSLWVFCPGFLYAQQAANPLAEGNRLYKLQLYQQAEVFYRQAMEGNPADEKAAYNLAVCLKKQEKTEEALSFFSRLTESSRDNRLKADAWYNTGVLFSQAKKLPESIAAYKNALRLNPADQQARENLQKALLELKKKEPPKKEKKKEPDPQKSKNKPRPKMNQKEAEQRLKLLQQKEKEVSQRMQKEKAKTGSGQAKDW